MIARETVFSALFKLGQNLNWNDPNTGVATGWSFSSRRLYTFDQIPNQPAFCQSEHDEMFAQITDQPGTVKLMANWVIYHQAGKDTSAVPAQTTNAILDAVQAALKPPGPTKQSLGGLVHHCWIDGKVFRANGDIDGQGLISVPISILIPSY